MDSVKDILAKIQDAEQRGSVVAELKADVGEAFKEPTPQEKLEKLEAEKAAAVAKEDFARAGELKAPP